MTPSFALDPALKISQYHHTSWAGKEGAPSAVLGIAEGPDGFLWLASPEGLLQFDGISFRRVESLGGDDTFGAENVLTLCADSGAGIWISFGRGHGMALFKDGELTRFKGRIATRCKVIDDVTWLVSNGHLARYENGRIDDVGADWGMPPSVVRSIVVDRQKTLFTFDSASGTMLYLPKGAKRFRSFKTSGGVLPLANATASDGAIWGASNDGLAEVTIEQGAPTRARWLSQKDMSIVFFDRDGAFWATDLAGLVHVGDPNRIRSTPDGSWRSDDTMTVEQGLSANLIWTMLEDRQGNIWLGTSSGLERFRDSAFAPVRIPGRPFPYSIAPAADGRVWAANFNSEVLLVDRHGVARTMKLDPSSKASANITGFVADTDDSILALARYRSVWRMSTAGATQVLSAPPDLATLGIMSVARSPEGALWIASYRSARVIRYDSGVWSYPSPRGLPESWFALTLKFDHKGRLWADNQSDSSSVVKIENDEATPFDRTRGGLDIGPMQIIYERPGSTHLWIGGVAGLAMFDETAFHSLRFKNENPPRIVTGILESSSGDLWIHSRTDGYKVDAAEMQKFYKDPTERVAVTHFDALDGLSGSTMIEQGLPTVTESTDGLIWFASSAGLAFLDPSRQRAESAFPKVHVGAVTSGEKTWSTTKPSIVLDPLTRHMAVAFTATSLGKPERLRFKYRLDDVDKDWKESGTKRVAYYEDLAPGSYRFHVKATNEEGNWGDEVATVEMQVPPAWFQTWTFRAAAGVVLITLLCLAYRTRVAQLTNRVRLHLRTQQLERERIARDLHDTLLQGVQGLIWRFHTLASRMPEGDPVRLGMEAALDNADIILSSSRDRVQDLRGALSMQESLIEQLQDMGDSLAIDRPTEFAARSIGAARELDPTAQNEICYIAREALTNAFAHSKASCISVQIFFTNRLFNITIDDNGIGIDPKIVELGKDGHFGLKGMHERAAGLGGELKVTSAASGTKIDLSLKAAVAYRAGSGHRKTHRLSGTRP